jgi:dUTPase
MVLLFNHSDEDFQGERSLQEVYDKLMRVVNEGDRIAQLILERISAARVVQVDELDTTTRGEGGFGSTGGFGEQNGMKRARVEDEGVKEVIEPIEEAE